MSILLSLSAMLFLSCVCMLVLFFTSLTGGYHKHLGGGEGGTVFIWDVMMPLSFCRENKVQAHSSRLADEQNGALCKFID